MNKECLRASLCTLSLSLPLSLVLSAPPLPLSLCACLCFEVFNVFNGGFRNRPKPSESSVLGGRPKPSETFRLVKLLANLTYPFPPGGLAIVSFAFRKDPGVHRLGPLGSRRAAWCCAQVSRLTHEARACVSPACSALCACLASALRHRGFSNGLSVLLQWQPCMVGRLCVMGHKPRAAHAHRLSWLKLHVEHKNMA